MPTFSIITASYNRAGLIGRCLTSALAQTYPHFEVIVVDDGSTDNTREVVRRYIDGDTRVRYLHQQNQGANIARNFGASEARGRYVLFLDSDDEALPNWLMELNGLIESTNPAIACCGIMMVDERGNELLTRRPPANEHDVRKAGLFNSGTYAVDRDLFRSVGGYAPGLRAHQSTELRFRLSDACHEKGLRITAIPAVMIRAYSHGGDKIRRDSAAKLDAAKRVMAEYPDRFQHDLKMLADWSASAAGCAANLGQYTEAQELFARAIRARPNYWKNYARWAICCIPGLRGLFWRTTDGY